MDLNNLHQHNDEKNEDVEPGELLEDCWFFGNLLHTQSKSSKSRMLRSFSDPCSSSNFPGNSYEETYESIEKLPSSRRARDPAATTTTAAKEISRSNRKTSSKKNSLARAPSLPTSLETEDFHDDEIEFSMGKLIRQASLNCSDTRPPRKNVSKNSQSLTASPSLRSRLKPEANQLKTQRSLKDLEIEELRGFKDLGFDFDNKDLSPSVVSVVPGLQEKKGIEERRGAGPYLSEAWAAHSSAPPVPRWGGKRSAEDVKAQIKFWARAVASNVRQEC